MNLFKLLNPPRCPPRGALTAWWQRATAWAFASFFAVAMAALHAVTCQNNLPASNPDSAYIVHGNGTATDTRSGLMWKVCREGQTWSAGSCTGTATTATWTGALTSAEAHAFPATGGYSDWRLPNLKELRSLVEECRSNPSINYAIFPATPSSEVWSGSPVAGYSGYAWSVYFGDGDANSYGRSSANQVRLVRGGQSYGSSVTVANLTPTAARLDVEQLITVTGFGFVAGTSVASIEDCPTTVGSMSVTNAQITFRCTPLLPGLKRLTLNGAPVPGKTLFVDHPTRTGNPTARGIPSINGVSMFNGNLFHEVVDMEVPGKGLPFVLKRSYNSYYWEPERKRGSVDNYKPWRFNWDLLAGYVEGTTSSQIFVQIPDGSARSFYVNSGVWLPIDQGSFDRLTQEACPQTAWGSNCLKFTQRNGLIHWFEMPSGTDASPVLGRLKQVCDHSNNCLTVAHGANGKVANVTDTMGRVFNFTYNAAVSTCGTDQLARVTTADGQTLHGSTWGVSYCWTVDAPPNDASAVRARINTVTDLRGQTWTYEYKDYASNASAFIGPRTFLWKIKDPLGKAQARVEQSIQAYGNYGVRQLYVPFLLSDASASDKFWQFDYRPKKADGADAADIATTAYFEVTATPPIDARDASCGPTFCARIAKFDAAGRLTSYTNANGESTQFASRDKANLTAATYNLAPQIVERKSAFGVAGNYGERRTYSSTQPSWNQTTVQPRDVGVEFTTTRGYFNDASLINNRNLLLTGNVTTHNGLQTGFSYDANGRLTQRSEPTGGTTQFGAFTTAGQPQTLTDARGSVTTLGYGPVASMTYSGYLTSRRTVSSLGVEEANETIEYDRLGRVIKRTVKVDASRNAVTAFEYWSDGQLKKQCDPLSTAVNERCVSFNYHPAGMLATRTDARGQVTNFYYDHANRLIRTEIPVAANAELGRAAQTVSARQEYDSLGRVTKQWSGRNNMTATTEYDPATGQAKASGNGLYPSDPTRFEYDSDGRLAATIDPESRRTEQNYYRDGLLRQVIRRNPPQSPLVDDYYYDADGRLIRFWDAKGNNTCYEYYPNNAPVPSTRGQLKKVRNAGAIADSVNHACSDAESIASSEIVSYDLNGNPTRMKDARGGTIDIEYDGLNRETKRTYYGDLAATQARFWTTKYDLTGNVVERSAPGSPSRLVTTYSYDIVGQLVSMTVPALVNSITFTYDKNGNRETFTNGTAAAETTTHYYDGANRLWKQVDSFGKTIRFDHDEANNRKRIQYANGQWVSYGYDALERMQSVTPWIGGATTYALDKSGRINGTSTMGNGTSMQTAFDNAGRLASLRNASTSTSVPAGTISSHSLTLDANGNWSTASIVQPLQPRITTESRFDMVYDFGNKLTSIQLDLGAPQSVGHDPAGRITNLLGSSYGYDGRDLLTSISGAGASNYTYNGLGQRISATLPSGARRYVVDPNPSDPTMHQVLSETDTSGNPTRHYIHGYGLVAQIDAANSVRHYHFDPTGNTLALTNEQGEITDAYAYTPYGETTALGNTVNPYRFNGKFGVADDGNQHHYMRARMYRPDVARFLSLDALPGDAMASQTLNRYAFALGNPASHTDPNGFFAATTSDSVAGAIIKATPRTRHDGLVLSMKFGVDAYKNGFNSALEMSPKSLLVDYLKSLSCNVVVGEAAVYAESSFELHGSAQDACQLVLQSTDLWDGLVSAAYDYASLFAEAKRSGLKSALMSVEPTRARQIREWQDELKRSPEYQALPPEVRYMTSDAPEAGFLACPIEKLLNFMTPWTDKARFCTTKPASASPPRNSRVAGVRG